MGKKGNKNGNTDSQIQPQFEQPAPTCALAAPAEEAEAVLGEAGLAAEVEPEGLVAGAALLRRGEVEGPSLRLAGEGAL